MSAKESVKRYEGSDGDYLTRGTMYVKASDYDALQRERGALKEENERLRAFIDKHGRHDWECELHIAQWDENDKRGIRRHGEKCTCEYTTDMAALQAAEGER